MVIATPSEAASPLDGSVSLMNSAIVYTSISIGCALLLSTLFGERYLNPCSKEHLLTATTGMRLSTVVGKPITHLELTKCLVFTLDVIAVAFVVSTAIVDEDLSPKNKKGCQAALYLCIVQYFIFKGVIQTFLIERIHVIRQFGRKRWRDPIWLGCLIFNVGGIGALTIVAFFKSQATIGGSTGCTLGLSIDVLIPLLAYDIAINLIVTAIFVHLLRPALKFRKNMQTSQHQSTSHYSTMPTTTTTTTTTTTRRQ
jgi:hypothetical protein